MYLFLMTVGRLTLISTMLRCERHLNDKSCLECLYTSAGLFVGPLFEDEGMNQVRRERERGGGGWRLLHHHHPLDFHPCGRFSIVKVRRCQNLEEIRVQLVPFDYLHKST